MRSIFTILSAVFVAAAVSHVAGVDNEPQITAQRVEAVMDMKSDLRPCDGLWIKQCAAGECWSPKSPPLACSPGSDLTRPRALPSHILTSPL